MKRAIITETRTTKQPQSRLDRYGYTLRSGSPTNLMVKTDVCQAWRRVYVLCFSNAASFFVKVKGEEYFVDPC